MYSLTMLFGKSTLAFMLLGLMKTARACGDGESFSIEKGTYYTCCSTTANAVGYAYSVDGGTHDDNIKFTVENDEGTVILDTGGTCEITNSGTRCSGGACTSTTNNNCEKPKTVGIEAQHVCIKMDCENWSANCDIDAWTVNFYSAATTPTTASPPPPTTTSPPPASSPPPPQTEAESADTSQNCKCSCCSGNYCSASIVASYDAESSSDCGAAGCRSRFSTLCPASGESGSVSASYSQSTTDSSSTTPAAATPTSDAASLTAYASSLAAVGISLILA